jgi:prolipoprotein diacylglyceryltransferase
VIKNFVFYFVVFAVGHFIWEYFFLTERTLTDELASNTFAATVIALGIYVFNKLVAMANKDSDSK